jgi:predicted ATPase
MYIVTQFIEMKITEIQFKNYKAFKDLQVLNIKPLTIIIGKNSSGKSVVTRLPLLLAQSLLPTSSSPIELQFDSLEFGGSFKDLVHNKTDHGNISFGIKFEDSDEKIHLEVTIQNIADTPLQIITQYSIKSSNNFEITLTWEVDKQLNSLIYSTSGIYSGKAEVSFKGLLIDKLISLPDKSEPAKKMIDSVNNKIYKAGGNVSYIGPFRELPKRDYIYKGSQPKILGNSGEFAPQILAIDYYLKGGVAESVSRWYSEHLGGWRLEIQNIREKFEIVLVNPKNPAAKINLVDVGHGSSQVLPLIVRSFLIGAKDNLNLIEQPELHLHPAAHGPLSELFAQIAKTEGSSWIIETHSEVFILRLRRLIAEGKINKNDVVIYLIDNETQMFSSLKRINIDEKGEIDFWPPGVFAEDYDELIAIRKAQKTI